MPTQTTQPETFTLVVKENVIELLHSYAVELEYGSSDEALALLIADAVSCHLDIDIHARSAGLYFYSLQSHAGLGVTEDEPMPRDPLFMKSSLEYKEFTFILEQELAHDLVKIVYQECSFFELFIIRAVRRFYWLVTCWNEEAILAVYGYNAFTGATQTIYLDDFIDEHYSQGRVIDFDLEDEKADEDDEELDSENLN